MRILCCFKISIWSLKLVDDLWWRRKLNFWLSSPPKIVLFHANKSIPNAFCFNVDIETSYCGVWTGGNDRLLDHDFRWATRQSHRTFYEWNIKRESHISLSWFSCKSSITWSVGFRGGRKIGEPGEKHSEQSENQQQTHCTGIEPQPHWWEASALATAQPLLPRRSSNIIWIPRSPYASILEDISVGHKRHCKVCAVWWVVFRIMQKIYFPVFDSDGTALLTVLSSTWATRRYSSLIWISSVSGSYFRIRTLVGSRAADKRSCQCNTSVWGLWPSSAILRSEITERKLGPNDVQWWSTENAEWIYSRAYRKRRAPKMSSLGGRL